MAYTETLYQLLIDCLKYKLEGLEYISHSISETLNHLLIDCWKYKTEGLEYISHGVYGNTEPSTHRLFEIQA